MGSVNYAPATFTLMLELGILLSLHRRRHLAGGLLLGCAFWLHAGFSWLLFGSLGLFALLEPGYRKTSVGILFLGLVVGSPWLVHLLQHRSLLQIQPRGEEQFLESPALFMALALFGATLAWKKAGIHRFWVAMALGFLPMLASYRFRFLATQGLFPYLMLAGIALEGAIEKMPRVSVALLLALAFLSPSVHFSSEGQRWVWADTTFNHWVGLVGKIPRPTAVALFNERLMNPLVREIQAHAAEDELIFSNVSYFGGMLNVLSGRAITNQMLRETAERPVESQIRPARLLVWLKDSPESPPSRRLQQLALRYRLEPLAQTELAYLYVNPAGTGRRNIPRPVIPAGVAEGLILLVGGAVAWSLRGRRFRSNRSRCRSSAA